MDAKREEVLRLFAKAEAYELDGLIKLAALGLDFIADVYNGTGAEWMREEMRMALDKLSRVFLPAVMIHDVDYATAEGTMLDFLRANRRLESNMLKIADERYKWYNPVRYLRRHQAHLYARVCDFFGWAAYVEGFEQYNKNKKGDK